MIPRNSNDSKNEQKLILDLDFFQKKKKKNIRKKQNMKILIVLEIFVYSFR